MTMVGRCFCLLLLISLSACSSRPCACAIEPPENALNAVAYEASGDPLIAAHTSMPEDWWQLFEDEQLSCYISTAIERNPSLHQAYAQVVLAQTAADYVRGNLYPTVVWGADVSRQKFSETGIFPFTLMDSPVARAGGPLTGGIGGIPVYFTQTETEAILTYEFDIWGKNRNTLCAALGEVQAKLADAAFSRLQLAIGVAATYYQLQIDYKRQQLARALVENQKELFSLTQQRLEKNLDGAISVHQSKTNVVTAENLLLQVEAQIAVNTYKLQAYLAGNFDEAVQRINIAEKDLPRVPLPTDLPLHLLSHRPDIAAQLWLIHSAGKQIKVAEAGFYPDFNLAALFGYQTIHVEDLFKWPSSYFNVNPAVTLPIFEGGRLKANLKGSVVRYDIAIYRYNQLVIDATRDVLDALTILRNAEQQLAESRKKAKQQEDIYALSQLRLTHHLDSRFETLQNQQTLLAAQDQEMVNLGNTVQGMLSLIKALGGGYQ